MGREPHTESAPACQHLAVGNMHPCGHPIPAGRGVTLAAPGIPVKGRSRVEGWRTTVPPPCSPTHLLRYGALHVDIQEVVPPLAAFLVHVSADGRAPTGAAHVKLDLRFPKVDESCGFRFPTGLGVGRGQGKHGPGCTSWAWQRTCTCSLPSVSL